MASSFFRNLPSILPNTRETNQTNESLAKLIETVEDLKLKFAESTATGKEHSKMLSNILDRLDEALTSRSSGDTERKCRQEHAYMHTREAC